MGNFSFIKFLEYLPKVLEQLDNIEKLVGLIILLLPVVLWLGIREMRQPAKGLLALGSFFRRYGVFLYYASP